ncbi:MAG: hypothetical protein QM627_10340 [Luteolibacter sp.]
MTEPGSSMTLGGVLTAGGAVLGGGRYAIECFRDSWDPLSDLRDELCSSGGFADGTYVLRKSVSPDSITTALTDLARLLSAFSSQPA